MNCPIQFLYFSFFKFDLCLAYFNFELLFQMGVSIFLLLLGLWKINIGLENYSHQADENVENLALLSNGSQLNSMNKETEASSCELTDCL